MESSRGASTVVELKPEPRVSNPAAPSQKDATADSKKRDATAKSKDTAASIDVAKPLAPPPRPGQQGGDYFTQPGGSLSLEPNPFEQSFGGGAPETPGGTKLPSVAALTSPSSLLPGGGATPYPWTVAESLRTGPLSPAMLSGPTNDYFGDANPHIRGGFPTPNESSLRTGLTPGGSGSMFPAPSPNTALFAQLAGGGGATPSTLEFHRTAVSAAHKRERENAAQNQQMAPTSQPTDMPNGIASSGIKQDVKPTGPFDPHDNDAANGLFMLAQGRNGAQNPPSFTVTSQPQTHPHPAPAPVAAPPAPATNPAPRVATTNGSISVASHSGRGSTDGGSEDNEPPRPTTRGKGKRSAANGTATTNGRRKADDVPTKGPAKKQKTTAAAAAAAASMSPDDYSDQSDDEKDMKDDGTPRSKMTDEEKRKNFLERNRVAALKCRQRKKQWLASLQNKVEMYSNENEALTAQISQLREEVVNLKTLLLAHKDCPVTQQQTSLQGPYMQVVDSYNGQMNPYGMAAPPMQNQPVMAGQPVQRRFS